MFNSARRRRRRRPQTKSTSGTATNTSAITATASSKGGRRSTATAIKTTTMENKQGGEPSMTWVMMCASLYVLSGVTQVCCVKIIYVIWIWGSTLWLVRSTKQWTLLQVCMFVEYYNGVMWYNIMCYVRLSIWIQVFVIAIWWRSLHIKLLDRSDICCFLGLI